MTLAQFFVVYPVAYVIASPFLHLMGSVIVTLPREMLVYREIILFFGIGAMMGYLFARFWPNLRMTAIPLGAIPLLSLLYIAWRELFVEPGWSIGLWKFLPAREGLAIVGWSLPNSTGAGYALGAYLSRFFFISANNSKGELPPKLPETDSHPPTRFIT